MSETENVTTTGSSGNASNKEENEKNTVEVDQQQQPVIHNNEPKQIVVSWFEFMKNESSTFTPTMLHLKDSIGNTLLHIACFFGARYDSHILQLIECYPLAAKQPNNHGCYPLHIACCFKASQHVLVKLIEVCHDASALKDVNIQQIVDSFNYDDVNQQQGVLENSHEEVVEENEIDDTQRNDNVDNNDDEVVPPPVDVIYVIDNEDTTDVVEHRHDNDLRSTFVGNIGQDDDDDDSSSNDTDDSASVDLNQDEYDSDFDDYFSDDDSSERERAINAERNEEVNNLVEFIVSSPFDMIQQKDDHGNYLLHIACRYCTGNYNDAILKLIKLYPIAAKQANNNGCFPLHIACCFGASKNVLLKLIKIYPEATTIKYYVSIDSIINSFVCHQNDEEGTFPSNVAFRLYKAECYYQRMRYRKTKLCKLSMFKNDDSSFGIGLYPLHMALRNCSQSKNVVLKLIEAFPQAVAVQCVKNDGTKDDYALHLACSMSSQPSKAVIQKLLELYPRSLHERNDDKKHPIHCAFEASQDNNLIKCLLEENPLLVIQQQDRYGDTPLHMASMERQYRLRTKYIPILKCMLEYSDNDIINMRNVRGETALHKACSYGFKEIVTTLLQHPGIDVNAVDWLNETPLHKLCSLSDIRNKWHKKEIYEVFKILTNQPFIRISHKNYRGMTPLDLLKTKISDLEQQREGRGNGEEMYHDDDYYKRVRLLPSCIKTMELLEELEELAFKQRCDAYRFHLSHFDFGDL